MQLATFFLGVPGVPTFVNKCASAVNFRGSREYWERRYANGRNSGAGSYGRLAQFKAQFLNQFVKQSAVQSVIEFGFGDGHQLEISQYPEYCGLDVSPTAAGICRDRFKHDTSKSFFVYDSATFTDNARIFHADLGLSLDVIYHLVEDAVFHNYMSHLFAAADRYVIVYSSNKDELPASPHVRHREFTQWVSVNEPSWELIDHVPNQYPFDPQRPSETSFADFFVFARR
jgi:hypothetical protein